MSAVYTLLIRLYGFGITILSLFNKKAAKWKRGRLNWRYHFSTALAKPAIKTLWVHAASLGEFEQGRPVIEAYRLKHPSHRIVLTFFSPSGYEVRKNYGQVDYVCYLPLDTPGNARDFIEIVKPEIALFVKYEFWFNLLNVLQKEAIPTYLVSGRMHERQSFFRSWGSFFKKRLSAFEHFLVQNEGSAKLLNEIGYSNVSVTGDTRFDRVLKIVKDDLSISEIEKFKGESKLFILGSSWLSEEVLLESYLSKGHTKGQKYVIAQHEINPSRISELERSFKKMGFRSSRISSFDEDSSNANVLFIDNFGVLSLAYKYADVAMVGGGFGNGIHNVLEPAVWGVPIIFGPRYKMFSEALDLVELGSAVCIDTQEEFNSTLTSLLCNESERRRLGELAKSYCREKSGATTAVMAIITAKN